MVELEKEHPINADEMQWLIQKYMKQHHVKRREAERMICANGFHKSKRLDEVRTPPNDS